jgi:hypothetical protein
MHHICLEVDDIEGMMAQLRSKNVRLINEEPRTAADGKKYAFIHPESTCGVLVELYHIEILQGAVWRVPFVPPSRVHGLNKRASTTLPYRVVPLSQENCVTY